MSTATTPVGLTSDDVLALPDNDRYELVDGQLVALEVSSRSQFVATQIARLLGNFCEASGLAYVFSEAGFLGSPGRPNRMRRPDVS